MHFCECFLISWTIKLPERTVTSSCSRDVLTHGFCHFEVAPLSTTTDPIYCVTPPGIGSGSAPLQQCIELAQRARVLQHWTSCQHLIIDEVSMVEAQFFDKLESVAR